MRKHDSQEVALKAKTVIKKWKREVDSEGSREEAKKTSASDVKSSGDAQKSPIPASAPSSPRKSSTEIANEPVDLTLTELKPSTSKKTFEKKTKNEKKLDTVILVDDDDANSKYAGPNTPTEMNGIHTIQNRNRNPKLDGITITSTGDKIRDKSMEMLYTALATNTDAGTLKHGFPLLILTRAARCGRESRSN